MMLFALLLFVGVQDTPYQLTYQGTEVSFRGLDPDTMAVLHRDPRNLEFWRKIFPVFFGALPEPGGSKPSILGSYHVEEQQIVFKPRFPFYPGQMHSAYFDLTGFYRKIDPNKTGPTVSLDFQVAERVLEAKTLVAGVFPSSNRLPANQLKFYIHFTQPMARGQAYDHIRLFEESQGVVAGAFLDVDPELWDPESRRLTLFFDPGRIKRGLRPHNEDGTPLQVGRRYRLVVDPKMKDASGAPLKKAYEKVFVTGENDRRSPNYRDWQITVPPAGTSAPLVLNFAEPMEAALAQRMISLKTSQGDFVRGRISLHEGESIWNFRPDAPWNPGDYTLHFDAVMEDLAGNQLHRLFDEEMKGIPKAEPMPGQPKRSFSIR